MGESNEKEDQERHRLVVPKHAQTKELLRDPHVKRNRKNAIRTTKYSFWSFLPKNLFEQFHRFANVYFLFIVILNLIPEINAFGKYIAMLPLVFVLSVTAIKDLFEDRRRYRSDKVVNNSVCHVYDSDSATYQPTTWKKVVVGDFISLKSDEIIPADLLLLNSSDENSVCHIETANLDGETNLKQREVVKGLARENFNFVPGQFPYKLKCELPNNHIYRFHGTLVHQDGIERAVGKNNLLLRGCVIRNTDWVEGMVVYAGHDTKAMMNNSGPRYKRSKVERDLNLDVISCVVILLILCFLGGIGCGLWTEQNDFFNRHFTPGHDNEVRSPVSEGFIRFWTFIIILQVLIPISLYVSMEIVKLFQVYFISNDLELYHAEMDQPILCRALNINEDLGQIKYVFSDKTGTLTENKMVFKKCTVGGRNFLHKERLGADAIDAKPNLSTSGCEEIYHQISKSSKGEEIYWDSELAAAVEEDSVRGFRHASGISSYLKEFFILLAICNTVVVSKKSARAEIQDNLETEQCDSPSSPDSSHTPSEEWVSSNTHLCLTNGSLPTSRSSVNNKGIENLGVSTTPVKPSLDSLPEVPKSPGSFIESANCSSERSKSNQELIYEAESPDEAALVKAASVYGYRLLSRSPDKITLYVPGEGEVTYELLHVLPFDSARKRMSVVVRCQGDSSIILYSKGADSAVLPRLEPRSHHTIVGDTTDASDGTCDKAERGNSLVEETTSHLDLYARDGLRTLCMARREVSYNDYQEWLEQHRQAETALHDRERLLHASAHKLECNLELLGATGIEDRLQEGVPETIATLREGGLKVWVLTGDKQETAINVAHASRLLDSNMQRVILNAKSKEECSDQITSWLAHFRAEVTSIGSETSSNTVSGQLDVPSNAVQLIGLVIDGRTLMYALEESLKSNFLELAKLCQVVLCCRATPLQKSAVVQLVRDGLKVMTLAIGDGANDVSMIQMADVGIGISGQEGMQAVMASDFAIGRFRFLSRLLLVHGHWCYDRITKMFLYFFFKNAMFVLVLFWFQLYNGFSGSNAIDDLSLIFFNLLFTAAPPIVCGVLDKDVPHYILTANPALYKSGQNGELYTRKWFWLTILDGLYESIVIFFAAYWVYCGSEADLRMVGVTLHQCSVIVANLYLALVTAQWTVIHHLFLWGSIILSFLWYFTCGAMLVIFWDMYYVPFVTMATKEFWSVCVLGVAGALLPRVVIAAAQHTIWPTAINLAQLQAKRRDVVMTAYRTKTTTIGGDETFHRTGVSVSL